MAAALSFAGWCVLQTDRQRREFDDWEQERHRVWIKLENKYGWWSKFRQRHHEIGV
jgi:hypothetical protein